MGYQPNAIARSMARGHTRVLACISPNLTDYTFAKIIEGAADVAREHDFFLLTVSAPDHSTFDQLMDELVRSGRVDGLIVIQPYIDPQIHEVPEYCPTVFAGGGAHANQRIGDSVVLDDQAVGRLAGDTLIQYGHTRLGMITGPTNEYCVQNRMEGYFDSLKHGNLSDGEQLIVEGDWSVQSGYDAFQQIWLETSAEARPTALFVQNDLMAAGVLHAAQEHGVKIPEELSLISIDDIPLAGFLNPPLTTLKQDYSDIGATAAEMLLEQIEGNRTTQRHQLLQAELLVRRSLQTLA